MRRANHKINNKRIELKLEEAASSQEKRVAEIN